MKLRLAEPEEARFIIERTLLQRDELEDHQNLTEKEVDVLAKKLEEKLNDPDRLFYWGIGEIGDQRAFTGKYI